MRPSVRLDVQIHAHSRDDRAREERRERVVIVGHGECGPELRHTLGQDLLQLRRRRPLP